jgi:NAD-dependent deacetylase
MKTLTILSGSGISAESGIKTFREAGGLWEGHDVMEVASPQGWERNSELVLDFYNQRRAQLKKVLPNAAHTGLKELEAHFNVQIITQNVDDLHERAGSTNILHLHGELNKVRSTRYEDEIINWDGDLKMGDYCTRGYQLRPHIVWFGEPVPMLETAIEKAAVSDIFVVIGTSMQVYPAASLIHYVRGETPIFFIDPKPNISHHAFQNLTIIPKNAVEGVGELQKILLRDFV